MNNEARNFLGRLEARLADAKELCIIPDAATVILEAAQTDLLLLRMALEKSGTPLGILGEVQANG